MARHAAAALLLILLASYQPLGAQALAPGSVLRDCSGCPEMVVLPPGRFTMGAGATELSLYGVTAELAATELPAHEVRIARPFAMGRFAVTRDEWALFAASTLPGPPAPPKAPSPSGCAVLAPSTGVWAVDPTRSWRDPGFAQGGREPVVCISWAEARAYAAWLGQRTGHRYRLPTEAEWEYAARAGSTGINYWGDDPDQTCAHANASDQARAAQHAYARAAPENSFRCNDGFVFTAPVDAFAPNAFGLYGMSGNVWQWVEDCFSASHAGAPPDGAARVSGDCTYRIDRGASWVNSPRYLCAAARHKDEAMARTSVLGLRVARDVAPPTEADASADPAGSNPVAIGAELSVIGPKPE